MNKKMAVASEAFVADNESAVSLTKGHLQPIWFTVSILSVAMFTGEQVTVDEENESGWWFVIKADGSEGWAPADYLSYKMEKGKPAVPALPSKPNQSKQYGVVSRFHFAN